MPLVCKIAHRHVHINPNGRKLEEWALKQTRREWEKERPKSKWMDRSLVYYTIHNKTIDTKSHKQIYTFNDFNLCHFAIGFYLLVTYSMWRRGVDFILHVICVFPTILFHCTENCKKKQIKFGVFKCDFTLRSIDFGGNSMKFF